MREGNEQLIKSISFGGTSIQSSLFGFPAPSLSFLSFSACRSSLSLNILAPSFSSTCTPAGSGIGPKLSSSSS
jgi:hypothetical protein